MMQKDVEVKAHDANDRTGYLSLHYGIDEAFDIERIALTDILRVSIWDESQNVKITYRGNSRVRFISGRNLREVEIVNSRSKSVRVTLENSDHFSTFTVSC